MDKVSKLYQLLDASAEKYPAAIALIFKEQQLTYKSLQKEANNISNSLKTTGVGEGDRVAIYAHKSVEFVASIFGILKTRAAYLPIDANAPAERNLSIIENCEAKAILVHSTFRNYFEDKFSFVAELPGNICLMKNKKSELKQSPSDLAYILYTSGSTGIPKGVMYTNEAALEFINWSSDVFKPTNADRFSSHAPFHFDLSIFDLYVSIKHGATLVLIDEETAKQPMLLAELISKQKISLWYSTPTILNMLGVYGKLQKFNCDSLRIVLFAGEVFPVAQFENLKQHWPKPLYYNLYGPTETNVCTYYKIPDESLSNFPIGNCCEHYSGMILNEENNKGELAISGKGLMEGYWETIELNGKVFYTDSKNTRWYKTGDIVQKDKDGNFTFVGRADRMVKRNGYRIELGEIESTLSKHPAITQCAVISGTDEHHSITITAFVSCTSNEDESLVKMKEYCMKHLPVYMIPNTFMFLKQLPQTASNKIDLQQLKKLL